MTLSLQPTNLTQPKLSALSTTVIAYVLAHVADEITLDDMAHAVGLSRFTFCRRFHRECGLPPMRWLWNFRAVLAAELITIDPRWSLTDIAFTCGFTSCSHFSRSFKGMLGISPSAHKKLALAAHSGAVAPLRKAAMLGEFDEEVATRAVFGAMRQPA